MKPPPTQVWPLQVLKTTSEPGTSRLSVYLSVTLLYLLAYLFTRPSECRATVALHRDRTLAPAVSLAATRSPDCGDGKGAGLVWLPCHLFRRLRTLILVTDIAPYRTFCVALH